MTQLELAKETVCSSLLHSVTKCEEIMQKTGDTQELLKLRKTQKNFYFVLNCCVGNTSERSERVFQTDTNYN